MKTKKMILVLVAILFTVGIAAQTREKRQPITDSVLVGDVAPYFSMPDHTGKQVSLSTFKGKYVLLDFWASWCPDCRRELPTVKALAEKYKAKGLEVVSVSFDRNREAWLKAIEKYGMNWTNLSELRGWNSVATPVYGIKWIPTSFVIDPDGKVVAKSKDETELQQNLQQIFGF